MPSNNFAEIREAIRGKRLIRCTYHGYRREIAPHIIGWKSGEEKLLSFQFGGESSKGLPSGGEWRCLVVSRIEDVSVYDGPWRTGGNHSRPQTCVDDVDTEVEF